MTTDGSSTVTGSIFFPPNSHSLLPFSRLLQVAYFVKCRQTYRGNHKCVLSQVTILCRNIDSIFKFVKEKQNPC